MVHLVFYTVNLMKKTWDIRVWFGIVCITHAHRFLNCIPCHSRSLRQVANHFPSYMVCIFYHYFLRFPDANAAL